MDNHRQQDNSRRQAFIGDLPQWNSRFRFSAQKKPPTNKVGHTNFTTEHIADDDASGQACSLPTNNPLCCCPLHNRTSNSSSMQPQEEVSRVRRAECQLQAQQAIQLEHALQSTRWGLLARADPSTTCQYCGMHVGVEGVKISSASEKSASLYQQTLKCFTPPSVCTRDWPALHAAQGATKASHTTPQEAEKTPTLCLFERFERLTLGVTPSTALNTAASAGAGHGTAAAAPDSAATSSSAGSEQCVARLGPGRRSVAFGTPSVLTYTPALPGKGSEEIVHDDEGTPLWSNAGVFRNTWGRVSAATNCTIRWPAMQAHLF